MKGRLKFESQEQDPVGSCSKEAVAGMFGELDRQIAHFDSFERNVGAVEFAWRWVEKMVIDLKFEVSIRKVWRR